MSGSNFIYNISDAGNDDWTELLPYPLGKKLHYVWTKDSATATWDSTQFTTGNYNGKVVRYLLQDNEINLIICEPILWN